MRLTITILALELLMFLWSSCRHSTKLINYFSSRSRSRQSWFSQIFIKFFTSPIREGYRKPPLATNINCFASTSDTRRIIIVCWTSLVILFIPSEWTASSRKIISGPHQCGSQLKVLIRHRFSNYNTSRPYLLQLIY